jgi:Na+-transporting NADH:ubiquinone oxidoreductase subunit NqrC
VIILRKILQEEVAKESLKESLEVRVEVNLIDTKTKSFHAVSQKDNPNY